MRVVRLADAPDLTLAWDRFVTEHKHGTFFHESAWLAYQRAYRAENIDASFAILDTRGVVIAVAPLIVSKGDGGSPEFSFSGSPTPRVLFTLDTGRVSRCWPFAEDERRRVAKKYGVRRGVFGGWAMDDDGPAESPVTQRVINLLDSEAMLWRDVRKSYKALIHRGADRRALASYVGGARGGQVLTDSLAGFAAYRRLHGRCYGDAVRPEATYEMQQRWLVASHAVLVTAADGREDPIGREAIGAALWYVWKGSAYYASGTYAEDNIAHAVVWRSLLALKAAGVTSVVMAWRGLERTEKERNVTRFKVGFGGVDVPVAIAEVQYEG